MKYQIIVDSTFYLSEEELKKYDIKQASLNIIDKDQTYKELEVNNDFIQSLLSKGHRLTTSQPSPGEFFELYQKALEKGAEKIFVITLAPPLSGTYQSATLAKKMVDNPDKVHIFESKMAAFGNEMLALELAKMADENKSVDEIVDRIEKLNTKSELIFTVESLISLFRSGRLSRAKAAIGTVLRVKPLIQMVDGKLDLFKSARTHKKVVANIIQRIKETTEGAKKIHFRILSHHSLEQATLLKNAIENEFKNAFISFNEYLGPVFSIHLGTNGYGLSWTTE
jgi:DegV family protein with EDD domain